MVAPAVGFRWLEAAQPSLLHWIIPPSTQAAGDQQSVKYTGGGDWKGPSGCSGSLSSGAEILRTYLLAHFPQIEDIHGYECRPIVGKATKMSVHATGRALDVMIPLGDYDEANSALGDPIANWLVENAEAIGVQYIIWDEYSWMAARPVGAKGKPYGGAHLHHDHIHLELTPEAAGKTTDWFSSNVTPPPGAPTTRKKSGLWVLGALVGAVVLLAGAAD